MAKDLVIRKYTKGVRLTLNHGGWVSVSFSKGKGTKESPFIPWAAARFSMIQEILAHAAYHMSDKKLYFFWNGIKSENLYSIQYGGVVTYEGPEEQKTAGDRMAKVIGGENDITLPKETVLALIAAIPNDGNQNAAELVNSLMSRLI